MFFLDLSQNPAFAAELKSRLPTLKELVNWYGPYLALVLGLAIAYLVMQYVWFSRIIIAKNKEISRLITREKDLNDRLFHLIDKKTGFKQKTNP
jgi:hypothetical protein